MKVLVLGGNGFIGSHIVDFFFAAGNEVAVLDIAYEKFREPLSGVKSMLFLPQFLLLQMKIQYMMFSLI